MSCGVGHRCSLDLALLWLWLRPAATAPIRPLAWELPHASGVTLKNKIKQQQQKTPHKNQKPNQTKKLITLDQWLFYFIFLLFRATLSHTEVLRLGVESELQLLAYATVTALPDLSSISNLYNSLWQCQILNPLSEARA